jgi:hypothetical protein
MTSFTSLRIVGDLLPSSLLDRVFAGDPQIPGTSAQTYGLERGESVRQQASRSWLYLVDVWQDFQRRISGDGPDAAEARSARVTRERWLRILLRELGFHQLTADGGVELDGKTFPVSHRVGHVPVHLLGWATDLDHKTPKVTARAPQSMVQELLNRDDSRLWAILSNGATLRLLRDSAALVGSAYVEFDLEAIFGGELFSDFALLYLVCHETRFTAHDDGGPRSCYLEQWRGCAAEQGERALDQLRDGVERAISILGTGFISHKDNPQLRARLDPGTADLKLDDLNRALLRLVYRLLFWFVAEDRDALLVPDPQDADADTVARLREARDRYATYFSSARLRRLARRHRGGRHTDLWEGVQLVFDGLGSEGGIPELALPGIGGIFESRTDNGRALPLDEPLAGARLPNEALLGAVHALSVVKPRGGGLRRVDFGNLGAEELGSVYESLLERIPHYDPERLSYTLDVLPGNERKESGSYYTPTSLVECLLDSALNPLLDEACTRPTPTERVAALLDITVCDPACGSGHFLVAAARRIAKRIAAEETGEPEPPDSVVRAALRRVTGRCIYGVDLNPMAAELARVALCMEALEPGKPLAFLDQNIRVGNSLLGVTPALLANGLPDAAFTPIEGDDRKICTALKKQNAMERRGQHDLFSQSGIPVTNAILAKHADTIAHTLPDSLEDLHIHQQRQAEQLTASSELRIQKLIADAWCAAFVQSKTEATRSTAITHAVIESLAEDATLNAAAAEQVIAKLTRQYRFFHWHVEFPHIFRVGSTTSKGWIGGFSCVIGNPPWDQVQVDPQEFFASRNPAIAKAANMAARDKLIAKLASEDPALYLAYKSEQRFNNGIKQFVHESGSFPLTSYGRLNTYSLFAEMSRTIISPAGRSGLILPTGIATDSFNQYFFGDIIRQNRLDSLLDFVTNPQLWTDVGNRRYRFSILVITGSQNRVEHAEFATLIKHPSALPPRGCRIRVSASDLLLVNPNTGTCPMFQTQRDADITIGIYKRVPILWREDPDENPWDMSFQLMFMMNTDSGLFRTSPNGDVLPLYEAKLIHHFDHRLASYDKRAEGSQDTELPRLDPDEKNDPWRSPVPRYWVDHTEVDARLARRGWQRDWLLGWREIARSTDERTMICSVLPKAAVGNKIPLGLTNGPAHLLLANLSSFVLDYIIRQKVAGTSVSFFIIKQLPVLPPTGYGDSEDFIHARVLELTYTAWDMEPFARDLGDDGPPFCWDEERRFVMRAELDAAFFRLYGIDRDDVDYIMEAFPIVKRKDKRRYGAFRTKELILEVYDAMAEAIRTGEPYQTVLDAPPAYGPRHKAR